MISVSMYKKIVYLGSPMRSQGLSAESRLCVGPMAGGGDLHRISGVESIHTLRVHVGGSNY